jgi:hypothetical protein
MMSHSTGTTRPLAGQLYTSAALLAELARVAAATALAAGGNIMPLINSTAAASTQMVGPGVKGWVRVLVLMYGGVHIVGHMLWWCCLTPCTFSDMSVVDMVDQMLIGPWGIAAGPAPAQHACYLALREQVGQVSISW